LIKNFERKYFQIWDGIGRFLSAERRQQMFENEMVEHVKFGKGNVVECDGVHIRVVFEMKQEEKTFPYPTVFEKFLIFCNEDAQKQVNESLHSKKEEEARINNVKRLLYIEAEKRRKNEKLAKVKKK
jgi:hypothetical protein